MKIRIISGTYGSRPYADRPHKVVPVSVGEVCDVNDKEAKRLIRLGVAEKCDAEGVATPPVAPDNSVGGSNNPNTKNVSVSVDGVSLDECIVIENGHFTAESLDNMSKANLEKLAADLGVAVKSSANKGAIIEALTGIELYLGDTEQSEPPAGIESEPPAAPGNEDEEDGDNDDDDEGEDDGSAPPDLAAAEPLS